MSATREVFVSVDVETAGPIPGEYSLLSIGARHVDDDTQRFSCELKPSNRNADPKTLEVGGLSLATLEESGLTPPDAMRKFYAWAKGLAGDDATLVFVGLNAPCDWSFVNYYFHKYLGENTFGFAALDIKGVLYGRDRMRVGGDALEPTVSRPRAATTERDLSQSSRRHADPR